VTGPPADLDLFAGAPDGIVVVDATGAVVVVNQLAGDMFGYAPDELMGQPVELLLPDRYRARHVEHRRDFAAKPARRPMGLALSLFGRRRSGEEFPVDISLNHGRDEAGTLRVVAFVRDVTARERLEAGLRASATQLHLVGERERIARDLHDSVIQRLFAIGLSLEAAGRSAPTDTAARLNHAVSDIDDTIRAIRSSIFSLSAHDGDLPGLRGAVMAVVTEFAPALGFEPTLLFVGPVDTLTNAEITEHLVATVREALANVARHAHATSTVITVSAGDEIVLTVDDDGVGDDSFQRLGGQGVANLSERARMLGGTAQVARRAPRGTRVEWRVPTPAPR
jgi:PAS domain S-box-containing protein